MQVTCFCLHLSDTIVEFAFSGNSKILFKKLLSNKEATNFQGRMLLPIFFLMGGSHELVGRRFHYCSLPISLKPFTKKFTYFTSFHARPRNLFHIISLPQSPISRPRKTFFIHLFPKYKHMLFYCIKSTIFRCTQAQMHCKHINFLSFGVKMHGKISQYKESPFSNQNLIY